MHLYSMVLRFNVGDTESIGSVSSSCFRPVKFYTSVAGPDIGAIDGLYWHDDPENQLIGGPFDAWEFSARQYEALRKAFYIEHGLVGKTSDQIQDYLDENDLTLPDSPRLMLPTLRINEKLKVAARFAVDSTVMVLGYTP